MRKRICLWLLALSLLLGGCAAPSAGDVLRQSERSAYYERFGAAL